MNILLIGSGGREHAIAKALSKSVSLEKLFCTPGNPGIFMFAKVANCDAGNFYDVVDFCKSKEIDLVVVGPEQPLAEGITDTLISNGIKVFGPSRRAAQLESSKGYAKDFMLRHNIPTADYKKFNSDEINMAISYVKSNKLPIVIKADGLAAGKGVIIATTYQEAHKAIESIFSGQFASAGNSIVIEQFLTGEEASILAISDGKNFVTLASSQDHKRVGDGDTGLNTGGMGAYSPAPIVTAEVLKKVEDLILKPTLKGMADEGNPFIGCLYAGLMIENGEPSVVEFNVRFGDPETQAVLSIFEGDFAELLYSASIGKLNKKAISNIENGCACCVILASGGYPGTFEKGFLIEGIENAESSNCSVYHAGTDLHEGKLVSNGGRVLGVTGVGADLKTAIANAYYGVDQITFDQMYYRKDIGFKGIK